MNKLLVNVAIAISLLTSAVLAGEVTQHVIGVKGMT